MSQKKEHNDNFTLKQKIGIIWFVICILILMYMFLGGGLLFAQYPNSLVLTDSDFSNS